MRILFARLLVVVTGLMIVALAILFAVLRNPTTESRVAGPSQVPSTSPGPGVVVPSVSEPKDRAVQDPKIARGRAVYVEQRCRTCHSIGGEGNTRSPLDDVGARLTETEIRQWIVAPKEMNPTVAKRGYRLPEEDLDALVAYLMATHHR